MGYTFRYAPQLNWNWKVYKINYVFNGFELYVNWSFPEIALLRPKICFLARLTDSFQVEACIFRYAPQLNWSWKAYNRTCVFNGFELCVELGIFRSRQFDAQSFSY